MRKQSRLGSGLAVLLSASSAGVFGATHLPSHSNKQVAAATVLPPFQLASAVTPADALLPTTTTKIEPL